MTTARSRSSFRVGEQSRFGFTLVELLVVIGIIGLLFSILLPAIGHVREQSLALKCAANLRQIGLAMTIYATAEQDNSLPRTTFDPTKKQLILDTTAGVGVKDSFGKSGYVGENNVPASLYLLMKTQRLPHSLFICPATDAIANLDGSNIQQSSSWGVQTPPNLSYSLASPFPGATANRFQWRNNQKTDFALVADINPGTRGGINPPNNVIGPRHDAGPSQMAAANSNNHKNRGQNVLYGDGHVEFRDTPYCGAQRSTTTIPDNIYTAGPGDGGATGDTAMPVDEKDSVLYPTDDPGGK